MEHTLGLNGKKVLANTEVAKRLSISPGAVSQRKSRIQSRLDEFYDINPFGG
jgi:DNA-directed RNA polymerase specialized sigma subunit